MVGLELKRLFKGLFNQAKTSRTIENWDNYEAHNTKHYKKRIRFQRTEARHNSCTSINSTNQALKMKNIATKVDLNLFKKGR